MFKKFVPAEDVVGNNLTKSSVQRGIRTKILEQYPALEEDAETILPKKAPIVLIKCKDHISLVSVEGQVLFFNERDGPYYPVLTLLHKYPDMLPKVQVDRGAIEFVLKGANIMCPGVTSKGGRLPDGLEKDTIVAIMAEGKEHALAVGQMLMSSDEIRKVNKGHGIANIHYLNDGLYKYKPSTD